MKKSAAVRVAIGATILGTTILVAQAQSPVDASKAGQAVTRVATLDATAKVRAQLVGRWSGSFNGIDFNVEYTDSQFKIADNEPGPYLLEGNEMTTTFLGEKHTSVLEFPDATTMIQTEKKTGTQMVLKRRS